MKTRGFEKIAQYAALAFPLPARKPALIGG